MSVSMSSAYTLHNMATALFEPVMMFAYFVNRNMTTIGQEVLIDKWFQFIVKTVIPLRN